MVVKKKYKKTKKWELKSDKKIKTFEKNPQKGGTPAIEKSDIISNFVRVLVEPKSLNVYREFVRELVSCKRVEKTTNKDKL